MPLSGQLRRCTWEVGILLLIIGGLPSNEPHVYCLPKHSIQYCNYGFSAKFYIIVLKLIELSTRNMYAYQSSWILHYVSLLSYQSLIT